MSNFPVWERRNLTMLTDFYELTMAGGYFAEGKADTICVFDAFFRQVPDGGGFCVAAGLEQMIEYMEDLHFDADDIAYLRGRGFHEDFLRELENFRFACDVWAIPEGTPVFPGEPLVVVQGPALQAQLLETALLANLNHQTLIATKANRIVRAAGGRAVSEFGARRAHGYDAAVLGARAAYIGGCANTSCVLTDRQFGVRAVGTMAHSWVQMFDSEYEAFLAYARQYPDNCIVLVDTYNVLRSGVPNAIRVFDEYLKPLGIRPKGIRIDSGDIAYLSKRARVMLDEAGYEDVSIVASNSLDEYLVRDLLLQGAKVDSFGIGENLITSKNWPVLGGVYKLAATLKNGEYEPKIKISETPGKLTVPGLKKVWRIYDKETGNAMADYVALADEEVDVSQGITMFHPIETWKRRTFTNVFARQLLVPIYEKGRLVYECPSIDDIRAYCANEVDHLWDEAKRFEFPHEHYVDLSPKLWNIRRALLEEHAQV